MTFSGLESTRAGKVENFAQMTWFCIRNIPTLFVVQFLSSLVSMAEKYFSRIFMTFPDLDTIETGLKEAKLKIGPRWLCFASETYPQCLGCISYHFPSVRPKNILIKFWRLFWALKAPEQQKMKIRHRWLGFTSETYPHCLGAVLIVSSQYGWKMFQSNFDNFSGIGLHRNRLGEGEVENRARMTPFCTRNIPTMFGVQFLSFPVSTAEKYFGQILTTFSGP